MITELQLITLILLSAIGLICLLVDGIKKILRMAAKFLIYFLIVLIIVYVIGYVEYIWL